MSLPTERSPGNAGHVPASQGERDPTLLRIAATILKHRRMILGWTTGTALAVVVLVLVTFSPTFTSTASFVPQGAPQSLGGGLEAMAGRFGVTVPPQGASESPEFYVDLLKSREILGPILIDTLTVTEVRWGDTVRISGTLLDLLEIEEESPSLKREEGIRWLREEAVAVSAKRETGVVHIAVTTPWPHVSQHVAARLLSLANDFNLKTRQSQASAERRFAAERLEQAREELRRAEDELKAFLERNRAFQNSPELVFEHDRLQRRVAMRQQIFTSLSDSYEQSRISEVRNTPVITIVEAPEEPVKRNKRGLILRGLFGLVLGATLGVAAGFLRETLEEGRRSSDRDYLAFEQAWSDVRSDMRHLLGKVGRPDSG